VIEFALVLPLVLLLLVATVEVAVVARTQLHVVQAAREGARAAAASPEPADAVAAVKSALGERGEAARVSVRRPAVVGEQATVSVALPVELGLPGMAGGFRVEVTGRASMRVER
jgi:Flp pilus assembly protein TadG